MPSTTVFSASARRSAFQSKLWREHGVWYLFLAPALLFYGLFVVYPFTQSVYLSLTSWNGADPIKPFVGLGNYLRLVQDELLWLALSHNVIWMVFGTAISISLGLLLAVLMWDRPAGNTLFRTFFFMPQVLAPIIVGIIWSWIFAPRFGLLNRVLDAVGLDSLSRGWLGDPTLALYAVLGTWIWTFVGFHFVVLQAGLQNVDRALIDAALIDGANVRQRFWHVTIPQLRPVLTLVTVIALIEAFKVFDLVFAMTGGGPANRTELIATYTYDKAFIEGDVGYGAALSMVLTLITLTTAVVVTRLRERNDQ